MNTCKLKYDRSVHLYSALFRLQSFFDFVFPKVAIIVKMSRNEGIEFSLDIFFSVLFTNRIALSFVCDVSSKDKLK